MSETTNSCISHCKDYPLLCQNTRLTPIASSEAFVIWLVFTYFHNCVMKILVQDEIIIHLSWELKEREIAKGEPGHRLESTGTPC